MTDQITIDRAELLKLLKLATVTVVVTREPDLRRKGTELLRAIAAKLEG